MPKIVASFKIDPDPKAKSQEAARREDKSCSSYTEIALRKKLARTESKND